MKRGIREERMEKWVEQQGVGRKGETAESKEQVISCISEELYKIMQHKMNNIILFANK